MNSRFSRTIGLSTILVLAGSVVVGCASTPDEAIEPAPSSESSISSESAIPSTEPEVQEEKTPALASDAASTLNAFFATISSDSVASMEKLLAEGSGENAATDHQNMSSFRKNYSKSYEFISFDMDQVSADKLISSYAMIYMFYPDFKITAIESGFSIDGNKAVISGDSFEVWMNGEVQPAAEGGDGNPGSIRMKFVKDKWLITGYDAEFIGTGEPEFAASEEYVEEYVEEVGSE